MIQQIFNLISRLLAEIPNRKESKPVSKNSGDVNVTINVDIDINH